MEWRVPKRIIRVVGMVLDQVCVNFRADQQYEDIMSEMFTFISAKLECHNLQRSRLTE